MEKNPYSKFEDENPKNNQNDDKKKESTNINTYYY